MSGPFVDSQVAPIKARGGGAGGIWGTEPPTFRSEGLISEIAPPLFVPKIFCRALFGAIREITVF